MEIPKSAQDEAKIKYEQYIGGIVDTIIDLLKEKEVNFNDAMNIIKVLNVKLSQFIGGLNINYIINPSKKDN